DLLRMKYPSTHAPRHLQWRSRQKDFRFEVEASFPFRDFYADLLRWRGIISHAHDAVFLSRGVEPEVKLITHFSCFWTIAVICEAKCIGVFLSSRLIRPFGSDERRIRRTLQHAEGIVHADALDFESGFVQFIFCRFVSAIAGCRAEY